MALKDLTRSTLFAVLLLICSSLFESASGIVNNRVVRVFDMDKYNTKQITTIEFVNDSEQDIDSYTLLVDNNFIKNLVYIEAKIGNEKQSMTKIETKESFSDKYTGFLVKFKDPLKKKDEGKLTVLEEYINRKRPFPNTMKITDIPKIRVIDDAYYPTIYLTKKMKSTFEIGTSATIIKATEMDLGEIRGRSIRYGFFKDVEPLTSYQIVIYVDYDDSLPIFTSASRTIFLSHWGPVSIEEEYRLQNRIPDLEGEFGRLDFSQWKTKFAINELQWELPKDTYDLYYTDEIGNITTSSAYRTKNNVVLKINPRFPVLGGWKTYWKQGYSLPKDNYIFESDVIPGQYIAQFNLSHPFDDIAAEEFTIKVVFPEGATDIKYSLPFEVDLISEDTIYQYLDMKGGSKVIIFKKKNIMEKYHNEKITVTFKLSTFEIYFKPGLLTFYALWVIGLSGLFYKYTS